MSNEIILNAFPSDYIDALTMLYLNNQNLSGKNIEEIHTMYWESRKAIQADLKHKHEIGYEFR